MLLLLVNMTFAQSRAFIVNESFDSANMPEGWYFTGEGSDNFSISTTNNAGGDANELRFKQFPIVTAGIHLVMATADLTGVESVSISFKHYLQNYQLEKTIGIATSSDNGSTWNTAWSKTYNDTESGQFSVNETVSTSDMGKSNVLFCLFFEGNTYNIKNWYFDDIRIFTQGGDESGMQLLYINVDNTVQAGSNDIIFTASNTGSTNITSFEARYTINGEVTTETFQTNLNVGANSEFTFSKKANLVPGTFDITIDILSVNGTAVEDITMTKEVKTYIRTVDRTPMIEHFTSSTCQNCPTVDNAMKALVAQYPGQYTYTKFPASWPGAGDPYNTKECDDRCNFYSIDGVPRIALDGQISSSAISEETLENRLNTVSYLDIIGAFETEGNNIKVIADVLSYIDIPNVRVFITINEKLTTNNVGNNGETEFPHIMLKMLGGSEGIETTFKAGEYQRFEFTHDMSTTFMEEIDDLEVSVWVQNYESKEVHNSSFLYEYMQHPYPAQNLAVTENGTNTVISWDAPGKGNPVGYNVYVNNNLVAEKTANTSYSASSTEDIIFVEIVTVYENDIYSIGLTNMKSLDCFAPENVEATTNATSSSITLTWDAVEDAASYKVYRNNSFIADVNTTSYTDDDIELGVVYCYTLRSFYDENNISAFSQEVCAHVGELPCDAPTNISAEVAENAADYEHKFKATITWKSATNAESYEVYINNELLGNTSTTSYITGFDDEGTYDVNVVTICENGKSELSETHKLVIKGNSINETESNLSIYPNPVDDVLHIGINDAIEEVTIYNIYGTAIYSQRVNESTRQQVMSVNVSNLNSGIYFLNINTDNGNIVKRFVKK